MILSHAQSLGLHGWSSTLVGPLFRSTISTASSQLAIQRAKLIHLRDKYEKTLTGKFVGDVDKKMRAELARERNPWSQKMCPCPCISTLRLDLATSRNQWFLVPAKNPGSKGRTWHLSRAVIYKSILLGNVDTHIPFSALRQHGTEEWVTPYWNIELKELRFRLRSGRDLDYAIPFSRIGNKCHQEFGKLAVAEGLIDDFKETYDSRSDLDGTYMRAYNTDVQLGYRGSIEEWQKTRAENRNGSMKIKTVIYQKGKEAGQIFVPTRGKGTNRAVFVGGMAVGLRHLARYYPPVLQLAMAEGLIKSIPDIRLFSFDLGVSLQRGFAAVIKSTAVKNRRDRGLSVLLGNGKKDNIPIKLPPPPRPLEFYLIPYIDAEQKLRVWDTERNTDIEAKTDVYFRETEEVRRLSPELFAYAQSLGHWQNV